MVRGLSSRLCPCFLALLSLSAGGLVRADEVCDDFPELRTHWSFRVPRCGPTVSLTERDDFLRIHVPDGATAGSDFDSWVGADFAPTLERTDMGNGDWIISTRVELETPPSGTNYHTGLVFYFGPRETNDAVYWGEYSGNGTIAIERAGNGIRPTYVADPGPVSLQVEKAGNEFHFRHRTDDGADWTEDVMYTTEAGQPLATEEPVTSVGLIVKTWGGAGSPDVTADFDSFCLEVPGPLPNVVVTDPIPVSSPISKLQCSQRPDTTIDLTWETCEGSTGETAIRVAGELVKTVPAGTTSATIPPPIPGGTIVNVEVSNGFNPPARCTLARALRDLCDEFDEDSVASGDWTFRTPAAPAVGPTVSFEDNPGFLRFHVPSSADAGQSFDNWVGADAAPTLERYDMGELDWTISTRFSYPEEFGIPVAEHHVGLMFAYGQGTAEDGFNDVTYWGEYLNGTTLRTERTGAAITPLLPYDGAPVSLQIQKTGETVTFSHRQEDTDPWTTDGQYTIQQPYPANAAGSPGKGTPVTRVGLVIKTWGGAPDVVADFDYFCLKVLDSPPKPVASATPDSGTVPAQITFSSEGSTDPSGGTLTYSWDFGDGSPRGEGASVQHTYTSGGLFTVTLTATDNDKNEASATTQVFISDDPAPLTFSRLGTLGGPGLVDVETSGAVPLYCLDVGGNAITAAQENAFFLNKVMTGDFKVRARVTEGSFPTLRARAGLMARLSLDAKSPNAAMLVDSQDDGYAFQVRKVDGQVTTKSGGPVDPARGSFPVWLQLERQGVTLIGSYSTDGTNFTEYSRADMDALNVPQLFVGFAATSGDARSRTQFCTELDFGDSVPVGPTFHRGDADANGSMQLTDAVRILNVLFLGTGEIPCLDAADADDNGSLQLTDAVRILNVLFLGVGTIPAPGSTDSPCGEDPTEDANACESYAPCN